MQRTRTDKIRKLLAEIDKEEIDAFILRECARDDAFANRFLALENSTLFQVNSSNHRDRVEKLIRRYCDRQGFIDYHRSFGFNREAADILDEADAALAGERWETAFAILSGIADAGEDIIGNGDDSAGNLSEIVDICFELLIELSRSDLPEKLKKELFQLALKRFMDNHLEGWDWWWNWIDIATLLADDEEKRNQVFQALDSAEAKSTSDWLSKHTRQEVITHKLELIRLAGDEEQTLRFMYDNMSLSKIREELLKHLWHTEKYNEILEIAEDGVRTDQEWPGRVEAWLMWEFKACRRTNDKEKTLQLARRFFLGNGYQRYDDLSQDELYSVIKSLVPAEEWPEYVDGLLEECRNHPRYDRSLYIYEKEKIWDGYIGYLKKHPSTHLIEHAPEEVKQRYKDSLIELYACEVTRYFQTASGRHQYQTGVELLDKLVKLGGKECAIRIKSELIRRTPRRPALIDELSKWKVG